MTQWFANISISSVVLPKQSQEVFMPLDALQIIYIFLGICCIFPRENNIPDMLISAELILWGGGGGGSYLLLFTVISRMEAGQHVMVGFEKLLKHYSDVIMGGMTSQITGVSLFAQPFVQAQLKENIKVLHHWLHEGNPLVTGGFPSQRASNPENISISWRHHEIFTLYTLVSFEEIRLYISILYHFFDTQILLAVNSLRRSDAYIDDRLLLFSANC